MIEVNYSYTKSYKNAASAQKAIEKIEENFKESFVVVMAARDDGRITPVIILSADQMVYAGALAHKNFPVVRA